MADAIAVNRLRGLILSASEIKNLTDWPDALIEDYLNILDNIITLADEIDTKNNIKFKLRIINLFFFFNFTTPII